MLRPYKGKRGGSMRHRPRKDWMREVGEGYGQEEVEEFKVEELKVTRVGKRLNAEGRRDAEDAEKRRKERQKAESREQIHG